MPREKGVEGTVVRHNQTTAAIDNRQGCSTERQELKQQQLMMIQSIPVSADGSVGNKKRAICSTTTTYYIIEESDSSTSFECISILSPTTLWPSPLSMWVDVEWLTDSIRKVRNLANKTLEAITWFSI